MLTVVIRFSIMLYRSVIVCVTWGVRWLLTQTVRSNCLRNKKRRSFYPSIRRVIKDFVVVNNDLENILSLEEWDSMRVVACSLLVDCRVVYRIFVGKTGRRFHLGDPSLDGRIFLRWIFRKWDIGSCPGLRWLRLGRCGGHLWMRKWTFGVNKM